MLFFPGEFENNNYRLLDARDGWNYLAVPITLHSGGRIMILNKELFQRDPTKIEAAQ